jgi:hypothetical protein
MAQQGSGAVGHGRDLLSTRPRAVLLAAIAICVVAVAIVAASTAGSGASSSNVTVSVSSAPPQTLVIAPESLTAAELKAVVAGTIKHPVFWAGPRPGDSYELQRTANGSVYIRYLPPGVHAGDPRSVFLLVATYPYPGALERLQALPGGTRFNVPGGGFALQQAATPTSVHLAFPGSGYEIEVYDHTPTTATRVAVSGDIRPVG